MYRPRLNLAPLAAVLATSAAAGQPAPAPATAPDATASPAPEPACSRGERSAISELACELGRDLGPAARNALVVAAPVQSDTRIARHAELGERVARVVAGAIGRSARSSAEPATLARARSLASDAGTLVHLAIEITSGELRVTADAYPVPRAFWDRTRDPRPSPTAHAFASRRLDAEVRTFLPAVPLVASRVEKAKTSEPQPIALACSDLDEDGSLELVLVGRRLIRIGRLRGGSFVEHATASWPDLSPVAQSPLREPLGSVAVTPGRHVDVGSSDRALMLRFDPALQLVGSIGRRIPWPSGGCSRFSGVSLGPQLEPCLPGDPEPALAAFGLATDAVAGARFSRSSGEPGTVWAGRSASEPVAVLRDTAGHAARIDGVGAQLAVGDLDGDGQPEIIAGTDTRDPSSDALVVSTWRKDGSVEPRYRLAVPTGVHALAICPPDGAGLAPVAVATRSGLWVVR